MVKRASLRAAWVALTIVAVLMLTFCGAALAAPLHPEPNSGASRNCVATSSGFLFSLKNDGRHLGPDVSAGASHGGQRDWVQDHVHKTC
jgi:hypothetical protein